VTAALAPVAASAYRIRTILLSAARGAALIGVAVLIGIVLLQVVDNPTGGGGDGGDTTSTTPATGDGENGKDNGTTNGGTDPSTVRTLVLNASGVAGAAGALSDQLLAAGYNTLPPADAPQQQVGTTVACNAGFEDATQPLIDAVGQGATATAYPADPPVPEAANADCIVFLGTTQ
jgi:LytR cell envelope-related transcriptional attenuator